MEVELRWGIRIPLRDGVHLQATVYLPPPQQVPAPTVVALTPYLADFHHERGMFFARHGLPFLIVDVRGRGNSEGQFRPFIQEAKDGFDVVEWAAQQPYCNGQVALWGGSYLGYVQWAVAKEFPPHLATIIPVAAPHIGVDFPMRNNIFYPYALQWLFLTSGRTSQNKTSSDGQFWSAIYRKWCESGRPFAELDRLVGEPSVHFQQWLRHPELGSYWDDYNPTPEQYSQLQLPILTLTGTYDDDQPGALEHYKEYMRHAAPAARSQHHLVIGPWDHARMGGPQASFGGLKCGAASLIDLNQLHLEWYAWTMQEGPKPAFLKKAVAYYVTGADQWKYADTLDTVTAAHQPLYLDSAGQANDVFCAGYLKPVPGNGPPDGYQYDPSDTRAPEIEAETRAEGGSLVDQSLTYALGGRELVYHSARLEREVEVSGFFKLRAWISIDTPDTDFYISVYEIAPDGSALVLSTDAMRARYREGLRGPKLISTDEPLCYEFERFTFVARRIGRGCRLRLVIAPVGRLIGAAFVQKNFNGGGPVAAESAREARPVQVRLFHDAKHPSVLFVPLGHKDECLI